MEAMTLEEMEEFDRVAGWAQDETILDQKSLVLASDFFTFYRSGPVVWYRHNYYESWDVDETSPLRCWAVLA